MKITEEMILAFLRAWHEENDRQQGAYPDDEAMKKGLEAALKAAEGDPGLVVLTATVYRENQARLRHLDALEAGGVDNWEGYSNALREYEEAAEDEAEMFRPKR